MAQDAQKMFGLGAQRIREEAQSKGVNFKIYTNQKAQYYLKSDYQVKHNFNNLHLLNNEETSH